MIFLPLCAPSEIPADNPAVNIQFRQDVTTQGETHPPRALASLLLHSFPSGQFLTQTTPAETAAAGALRLIRDVAAALPSDPAQDDLVEKLFAQAVGVREAKPLRKPAS
jgi:hypothetical protein